tara:strand:- start:349 stop:1281 length:933 start_codon:yes stop_codon:yes gene_type:complete
MKLNKPNFWDKKIGLLSLILYPISLIVIFIVLLRKKLVTKIEFGIPVICVGNIYLGGTGKTPTSIFIANELKKLGKKPVIIKKFYKSHYDEYNLIKEYFSDLIVRKNRSDAIKEAKSRNFDIVILDDGLQEYKIRKNLNIVCFSQKQLIGNGLVLPSGPLRESLNAIKEMHIVLINGNKDEEFENKIRGINKSVKIYYANYEPENINDFINKKIFAIAGIGNPPNFFDLLIQKGLNVKKTKSFPDHFEISKLEMSKIVLEAESEKCEILTTEKDFLRMKNLDTSKINYLKVKLNIPKKKELLDGILKLYA